MYVERDLETEINRYLKNPEAIAILGPRQSGKTTLLKRLYEKDKEGAVFLDFEDRDVLRLFNEDIKAFCTLYVDGKKRIFIDEFQYALEGGKGLKYIYDTYGVKIFITGSSSLDLTDQAVKFLVGRIFLFYLYPFSFGEFLKARNLELFGIYDDLQSEINDFIWNNTGQLPELSPALIDTFLPYYYEYLIYGGYPRVVLADSADEKKMVLKGIYNTYFLREIREILQVRNDYKLESLLKALALQVGGQVSYTEIGQLSGLKYHSVKNYLNILEQTFVIKRALPFFSNKRLEIAKSPKVFFCDNGFRNIVINNFQHIQSREDRGSLNENFIAGEFIKRGIDFNYWRTKSLAEIDFIVQKDGILNGYEAKSRLFSPKIGKSGFAFLAKYKPNKLIVLSENYYNYISESNILFLPIFLV